LEGRPGRENTCAGLGGGGRGGAGRGAAIPGLRPVLTRLLYKRALRETLAQAAGSGTQNFTHPWAGYRED